jgi:hypothetical protein
MGITVSAGLLRASPTIASYSANISKTSSTGNTIDVEFYIIGTNTCDVIGVSQVVIQKKVNGDPWEDAATLTGAYEYNTHVMSGHKYYTGTTGIQYRAIVYFTATQGSISDSKTYTTSSITI